MFVAVFAPDETGPSAEAIGLAAERGGVVPPHWPLEIANSFRMAIRRKRFEEPIWRSAVASLGQYDIEIEPVDLATLWTRCFDLAGRHGLTLYDAAYLELAARRALPLLTLDARLRAAAGTAGVAAPDPRGL